MNKKGAYALNNFFKSIYFFLDKLESMGYILTRQTSWNIGNKGKRTNTMAINLQAKTGAKNVIWQLQEAKAMLSEVVKASAAKPQIISVRGKETAVILSFSEYQRLVRPKQTFFDFIQSSPLYGLNLELPARLPEEMRDINL